MIIHSLDRPALRHQRQRQWPTNELDSDPLRAGQCILSNPCDIHSKLRQWKSSNCFSAAGSRNAGHLALRYIGSGIAIYGSKGLKERVYVTQGLDWTIRLLLMFYWFDWWSILGADRISRVARCKSPRCTMIHVLHIHNIRTKAL